jgi:hypothetical protein
MSNCCSHGNLPYIGLQSSHLNICYSHQDLHYWILHAGSRHTLRRNQHALLLIVALHLQQWPSIGQTLKRHPFSGLVHSAGELLHTP